MHATIQNSLDLDMFLIKVQHLQLKKLGYNYSKTKKVQNFYKKLESILLLSSFNKTMYLFHKKELYQRNIIKIPVPNNSLAKCLQCCSIYIIIIMTMIYLERQHVSSLNEKGHNLLT